MPTFGKLQILTHFGVGYRAMQHAIPVLASAGQKRRRTEQVATSSLR